MDYVIGVDTPRPMWAEQWPDVRFAAVTDAIKRLTAKARIPASSATLPLKKGWVRLDECARPHSEVHAKYEKRFKLYCGLHPSLKNVMHGLQD